MKPLLLIGIIIAFILASCTVDKRLYKPGFRISFKTRNDLKDKQQTAENLFIKKERIKDYPKSDELTDTTLLKEIDDTTISKTLLATTDNTFIGSRTVAGFISALNKKTLSSETIQPAKSNIISEPKKDFTVNDKQGVNDKYYRMALAGFILGIIGVSTNLLFAGIPAIILSAIALKHAGENERTKRFATIGLILGIFSTILFLLVFIIIFILFI